MIAARRKFPSVVFWPTDVCPAVVAAQFPTNLTRALQTKRHDPQCLVENDLIQKLIVSSMNKDAQAAVPPKKFMNELWSNRYESKPETYRST